jgi:PAS domain S-box-containing protein
MRISIFYNPENRDKIEAVVKKRPQSAVLGIPGERDLDWLRLFGSSTSDAFWDWDIGAESTHWQEPAPGVFGYGAIQAPDEWWRVHVHPEDIDRAQAEIQARLQGRDDRWSIQFRLERKTGDYLSVLSRAVIVRDAQGRANRVLGTLQSEPSASQLLRAQDEERRRIARELHDVTGQKIAALQLHLWHTSQLIKDLPPSARGKLDECISLAENCLLEIRTVSYLLHPPLLDELGLEHALQLYLDGFSQRSGIKATLNYDARLGRLPPDWELALYRIVQEGLTNIHRHSGSSTLQLRVRQRGDLLALQLTDQGGVEKRRKGKARQATFVPGMGIAGMRERAQALGGDLRIESKPHGTVMVVKIPLPKR